LKNPSLPSHNPSARNSTVRRKFTICFLQNPSSPSRRALSGRCLFLRCENLPSSREVDQRKLPAMKTSYRLTVSALVLLSLSMFSASRAQQTPSAITTDPEPIKDSPPSMDSPDIMSHGSRLNAIIYLAAGNSPHGTVLLMHGFPGNEQNLD